MRFLRWLAGLLRPAAPTPTPAPFPDPAPEPQPPAPEPAPAPPGVVDAINAERARYRLAALRDDPRLTTAATNWAQVMARNAVLTHGDFPSRIAEVVPNTVAAEVIAEGATTVNGVVALWMHSPPHRANILGDFSSVGAGRATAADGTLYWCVDFDAQ